MKCTYRQFQKCIVQECPACIYEEVTNYVTSGRSPYWMDREEAISRGYMYEEKVKSYKFVSCRLIENGVQPTPVIENTVNNTTKLNIAIKRSIF